MNWTKINKYPFFTPTINKDWKPRTDLFWEFVNYFEFDRMAHFGSVGSVERLLYGKRSYNNTKNSYRYGNDGEKVPEQDHCYIFKKSGTDNIVCV